mmetsp:Transcript_6433/g.14037  ORF Transcript_6433/g.14037 Transcript_6433/m.14037 type:complete len:202 (-) Transcript_6433:1914-2519(-)
MRIVTKSHHASLPVILSEMSKSSNNSKGFSVALSKPVSFALLRPASIRYRPRLIPATWKSFVVCLVSTHTLDSDGAENSFVSRKLRGISLLGIVLILSFLYPAIQRREASSNNRGSRNFVVGCTSNSDITISTAAFFSSSDTPSRRAGELAGKPTNMSTRNISLCCANFSAISITRTQSTQSGRLSCFSFFATQSTTVPLR